MEDPNPVWLYLGIAGIVASLAMYAWAFLTW